jgi:hypothetical protein
MSPEQWAVWEQAGERAWFVLLGEVCGIGLAGDGRRRGLRGVGARL